MKSLVRNCSVLLLITHFSISTSNSVVYSIVMSQLLKKYGVSSRQLAVYSLISLPFSVGAILGAARLSGHSGKFKSSIAFLSFLPIIILVLCLAFQDTHWLYGIVLTFFSMHLGLIFSVGYEFLSELSFPVGN